MGEGRGEGLAPPLESTRRACSEAIILPPSPCRALELLLFLLVNPAGSFAEEGASAPPPPPSLLGGIGSVYQKAFLTSPTGIFPEYSPINPWENVKLLRDEQKRAVYTCSLS